MSNTELSPFNQKLQWIIFLAMISFFTTLNLPYIGEEGVYTITSLEMWQQQSFLEPTLFGLNYGRPPMYNWLIIPVANLLGWENVLPAARLVTLFATLATGLLLGFFSLRLFNQKSLSLLAVATYFSGDLLMRRGWLAYSDPTFAFFTFASVVGLWLYCREYKKRYLLMAAVAVNAAMLSKAFTAYVFYAVAVLVVLLQPKVRVALFKTPSLIIHALMLTFPIVWSAKIAPGAHGEGMLNDMWVALAGGNGITVEYSFSKILAYPFKTLLYFAPISLLCLYLLVARKDVRLAFTDRKVMPLVLWCVLCYLPYWLSPKAEIRYLLPLYPIVSLLLAYTIISVERKYLKISMGLLSIGVLLKLVAGTWGFSYYEQKYRGDYAACAKYILQITAGEPLYNVNDSSVGLGVAANINRLRAPVAPLTYPAPNFNRGFVITHSPQPHLGQVWKKFTLGRQKLYLLCQGMSCQNPSG